MRIRLSVFGRLFVVAIVCALGVALAGATAHADDTTTTETTATETTTPQAPPETTSPESPPAPSGTPAESSTPAPSSAAPSSPAPSSSAPGSSTSPVSPSGTLQLSAVMRDTGVPVAGIGVQVYTPDPVAVTTPASVRAATPNVSFVVTTVPEGLQLVGPRQVTVPVRAGETSSYVFQLDDGNRPPAGHGTIRVTARDVTHDTALPGVTVSVGGPEVNQSLRLPASITGRPGTYLVTVTGVPRGYRLVQHGAATITLAAGQTVTREFQFAADDPDGPSGTIAITKKNRVTGAALAGAGFAVTPCGGGEVIARVTTGTDGTAATDVRPGCYRVAETVAPAGYVAEYISYETWVINGRTADLTVYNLPNGHVSTRDVERRVPLRSIPSGPVTRP